MIILKWVLDWTNCFESRSKAQNMVTESTQERDDCGKLIMIAPIVDEESILFVSVAMILPYRAKSSK